jgi:hypothetical protein
MCSNLWTIKFNMELSLINCASQRHGVVHLSHGMGVDHNDEFNDISWKLSHL